MLCYCHCFTVLPNSESNATKKLQADDVSLAYEFSKKFPGVSPASLRCTWPSPAPCPAWRREDLH